MSGKYGNRRTEYDGYTFDSLAECARYQELRLLEKAGEISDLKVHPQYELLEAFTDRDGKRQRAIYYEGDFEYVEKGQRYPTCEDVKGVWTPVFRLKLKLFNWRFQHIRFRLQVVGRKQARPVVVKAKGEA